MSCSGVVPGTWGCMWALAGQRGPAGVSEPLRKWESLLIHRAHPPSPALSWNMGWRWRGSISGVSSWVPLADPALPVRSPARPLSVELLGHPWAHGCPGMVRDELHGCLPKAGLPTWGSGAVPAPPGNGAGNGPTHIPTPVGAQAWVPPSESSRRALGW